MMQFIGSGVAQAERGNQCGQGWTLRKDTGKFCNDLGLNGLRSIFWRFRANCIECFYILSSTWNKQALHV